MGEHMKYMYDRNKPHNTLPDLPPNKDFLDIEILMKWGLASRNLAELNKNVLRIPNPSMFVNTVALREAQTSTAIENIFTTDEELYKAISSNLKEENTVAATKEVLNYREALWEGFTLLGIDGSLSEKAIISIFQRIKKTKQGYRSPQSLTVIRRGNSELKPGEVIYTPPRGDGIIERKIQNLLTFLQVENGIDPLIKMAISHYQFEAIHPFTDGNGRTGRILNLLYLVEQQLLSHPVLYLSRYILQHKDDYYHLLSGVTQRGAWKPWLMYMMEAVEQTSKYTNQMIDDIIMQQESTLHFAKSKLKWYTNELNTSLFSQPYIKQKTLGEVLGVTSRTTLVKYAGLLVAHGIVSMKNDGKEVYYVNDDLLRILGERM
jgi:Fic family protein